jgi:hypothetical protein
MLLIKSSPHHIISRKASVGIRTRDPHLTKMVRYHCATEAGDAGATSPSSEIIGVWVEMLEPRPGLRRRMGKVGGAGFEPA